MTPRAPLARSPAPADPGRWARRFVSLGGLLVATLLAVVTLPVWLVIALMVDVFTGRTLARAGGFVLWYLVHSVAGVGAASGLWLAQMARLSCVQARYAEHHHALQRWWARRLFAGLQGLFGLTVQVETLSDLSTGPLLLLSRHVSTGDTILPVVTAAIPHRLRVRYVLKQELLWDPCLDIVGQRVPNAFVARGGNADADLSRVRALADDLGPRDCIVLFPEGTRFTDSRRARILARLERKGETDRLARAQALRHVLPVRAGGLTTLLDAAVGIDVVFLAHTGLEGITRISTLADGTLFGRTLRVQLRRVPGAEVPQDPAERLAWLHRQWQQVDDWVDRSLQPSSATAQAPGTGA